MLRKLCTMLTLVAVLCVAGQAQAKQIIKMGLGAPVDAEMGAIAKRFKEIVEARTNGAVEVQIFPNSQLGDENEMIQNVRRGDLDIAVVGIANTVPLVNKLGLLTLPYLFEDMYQIVRGTTGPGLDMLNRFSIKEGGFRILGFTYTDYRYLSNNKRPIKKLADIKGLKFRVPQSAVLLETYKSWGTTPVPISWSETFTALQQGVVDGQCYGYITFQAAKFNEVQKYVTEVRYTFQLEPMLLSEHVYRKMSPELQEIVVQAGLEAQEFGLAFLMVESGQVKEKLIAGGTLIIDKLEDEEEWKRRAVETVWPKMKDFVGGQAVIDEYLGHIGKK